MPNDAFHEYFITEVIPFTSDVALLGADTNGAVPQQIFGVFVEAEIYGYKDELETNFWIKTVTDKKPLQDQLPRPNVEFLAYSDNLKSVEELFGSVVKAHVLEHFEASLSGTLDGYRNSNQTRFDENLCDDAYQDLTVTVSKTDRGFAIVMAQNQNEHGKKVVDKVASVHGKFDSKALSLILSETQKMRDWVEGCERAFGDHLSQTRTSMPSMGR